MIRLHLTFLSLRCVLRRGGHHWQDRSFPISCGKCGKSVRVVG